MGDVLPPLSLFSTLRTQAKQRLEKLADGLDLAKIHLFDPDGYYRQLRHRFEKSNIQINCFLCPPEVEGFEIDGIPYLAPASVAKKAPVLALGANAERLEYLRDEGFERVLCYEDLRKLKPEFPPLGPGMTFDRFTESYPKFRQVCALFRDRKSIETMAALLKYHVSEDPRLLPRTEKNIYFREDFFKPRYAAHFVDCGAYNGDTLKCFLRQHASNMSSYIALEPDPSNFAKLKEFASVEIDRKIRARVKLVEKAVWSSIGSLAFTADKGNGSCLSPDGKHQVAALKLDEFSGRPVSMIKFDVEGAELEALEGGRGVIREQSPALAVSAYHEVDHLWQVPLKILELDPRYRLDLRHHGVHVFDTICYATPP